MQINRNRKRGEDLEEMIAEMKIGDQPIFDEVTCWDITRVPGGLIYKNEYAGAVFVPYEPEKKPKQQNLNFEEKKVTKPANTKKVVTK